MAAWGAVLALTGFHYSGVTGTIAFDVPGKKSVNWFWSTGYAWGTVVIEKRSGGTVQVTLSVLGGTVKIKTVELAHFGKAELGRVQLLGPHKPLRLIIDRTAC